MGADDGLPKLPAWKDYRQRHRGEELAVYLQGKLEYDIQQERDRDHWFIQVFAAMIGNLDLLHNDLLGDGSLLRKGILPQLFEEQKDQAQRLAEIPKLVREIVTDAGVQRRANDWTAIKKFTYGLISIALATFIAALIWLLVVGHK